VLKSFIAAAAAALSLAASANAATIDATTNSIVSTFGGPLQITFVSKTAAFSSDLVFNGSVVFNNQAASPGFTTTVAGPAAGAAADFSINVLTTGNTFLTGLAALNADGLVHAVLMMNADGSIMVGFEDLFGGGDLDFDDLVFKVTELSEVPVPGALALMLTGLAGFGVARRRKAKA
jgi:hypothetical protein